MLFFSNFSTPRNVRLAASVPIKPAPDLFAGLRGANSDPLSAAGARPFKRFCRLIPFFRASYEFRVFPLPSVPLLKHPHNLDFSSFYPQSSLLQLRSGSDDSLGSTPFRYTR